SDLVGVVEPMIPLQNRINQTIFDLLVAQTYTSHEVSYATGMAPPLLMEWVDEHGNVTTDPELAVESRPKIGPDGNPMPAPINHNARQLGVGDDVVVLVHPLHQEGRGHACGVAH